MDKVRTFLLFLLVSVMGTATALSANKAYKVLGKARIYEFEDKQHNQFLVEANKGDTVYATPDTEPYIRANEGHRILYVPAEYKGIRGWVEMSDIYPIKLAPEDSLVFDNITSLKSRTAIERYMVPQMEWAMNLPYDYLTWIYAIIASLVVASCLCFAATVCEKVLIRNVLYGLTSLSLLAMSAFEMVYILSFYENVIWFLMPSVVGGWGYAILFLLIMSVMLVAQAYLLHLSWSRPFREKDSEETTWVGYLSVIPVLLGLVLLVLMWVDYFCDTPFAPKVWVWTFSSLALAALVGLICHFRHGRILSGIIFPVCYVGTGIGLSICIMVLSMIIFLAIIVGILGVLAVVFGLSFLGALFGSGDRVKGYTSDGKAVTGWEDIHGNIHGDDGNIYTKS